MHKLFLANQALDEMGQAFEWYEEQSAGLGQKFIASLEKSLGSIQKNPFNFL